MKNFYSLLFATVCLFRFASANIYTINSTTDFAYTSINNNTGVITAGAGVGSISLRSAIQAADALGGNHTINVPAGTYNLVRGAIVFGNVAQNISFIGAGAAVTVINMTTTLQDRIFFINPPGTVANVITFLSGLRFTGGRLTSDIYGGGAILAGGPGNALSITSCTFDNNTIAPAGGTTGGAVNMSGGGALTINLCAFSSNSNPISDGGAVYYFLQNFANLTGSLTVTNSTFTSNTTTAGSGGAIGFAAQGATTGQTFSVSIQRNTFINNNASSNGGAITANNSFGPAGIVSINYNRFVGNTAGVANTTGLGMTSAAGSVVATDNWWGCNAGPGVAGCNRAAIVGSGGAGTLNTSTWLQLKTTSSPAAICTASPANTGALTASFLTNSAGTAIAAANLSTLIGLPVSFASTLGSISSAQSTIQSAGTATATFTSSGTAGSPVVTAAVDGSSSAAATLSVTTTTLASGNATVTQPVGTTSDTYLSSCQLLLSAVPNGVSPISGSVTSKIWIEGSVPTFLGQPFVARHYEITPGAGSTGRVTLYFTQAEFDAFNAAPGSLLDLPANAGDAAGKANLRIGKYAGTSSGSGLPASYSGSATVIDPVDNDITYDAANSRWVVAFDVVGFSGFIVQTSTLVLPVTLVSFYGTLNASNHAELTWKVAEQQGINKYIVESSTDGIRFDAIGTVAANTSGSSLYSYTDPQPSMGRVYYRLRIEEFSGSLKYSTVVKVGGRGNATIVLYPNPATDNFVVQGLDVRKPVTATITDMTGRRMQQLMLRDPLQIINIGKYPAGVYLLILEDGTTFKINKK